MFKSNLENLGLRQVFLATYRKCRVVNFSSITDIYVKRQAGADMI